jgi:hypothetical protein
MKAEILLEPDMKSGNLIPILADWALGQRQLSISYYPDQNMTPRLLSFIYFSFKTFIEGQDDFVSSSGDIESLSSEKERLHL